VPDRDHIHLFDADTGAAISAAPATKEEPVATQATQSTPPSDPAFEGGALHERQPEQ